MSAPPPPPRRTPGLGTSTPPSRSSTPEQSTWSSRMKAKGAAWGKVAMDKGMVVSDKVGARVNDIAEKKFGTERFYPTTGDFVTEIAKCARILRAFTVEGVVVEEKAEKVDEGGKTKEKKKVKVLRKIPPEVMAQAKGVAIFTSMRSGIAPLGGSGGSGLVIGRLPDGSWSPPASISPNNLSTGFLLGLDVYDCVLVIRSQAALDSFSTHKATLGVELGVSVGPWGAGAAVEAGKEKAPVFSYVKSRGMYAGIELVGQVFVERFDENAAMYHYPGVKAGEILAGKVKLPVEAAVLHQALKDAESGKAQAEGNEIGTIVDGAADLGLSEGEVLKLPPTPEQTDGTEYQSDPETHKVLNPTNPLSTPQLQPPAIPARPTPLTHSSSTSYYSTQDEDLPPGYETGGQHHQPGKDKKVGDGNAEPQAEMSEAERREWEQHLAQEAEERGRG